MTLREVRFFRRERLGEKCRDAPMHEESDREHSQQWVGKSQVKGGSKTARHILTTCQLLGMQLVWSTEMGMAAPYLLSLGLSKPMLAVVLLAGPISGLVVQPIVGSISDNCKLPLGRRRPFILAGTAVCATALLLFGWAKQVAGIVSTYESEVHRSLTLWLAGLSLWVIDFSVNAVQAADRALLVDVLPASEQAEVNAWAGRLTGLGAIAGFGIAEVQLSRYFGFLGTSQMQILAVLVSLVFVTTHLVTCWAVTERVLLSTGSATAVVRPAAVFRNLWHSFRRLPDPIWRIYLIQCFLWIGWFAVMFYSTTWVSEMYLEGRTLDSVDAGTVEAAERVGSNAMLWHAVTNFITTVFAPMIINHDHSYDKRRLSAYDLTNETALERIKESLRPMLDRCQPLLPSLPIKWLTLTQAWAFSNSLFAFILLVSYFVFNAAGASVIIAITGFCWAFTNWVPFTLLGELILQTGATKHRINGSTTSVEDLSAESFALTQSDHLSDEDEDLEKDARNGSQVLELHHADEPLDEIESPETTPVTPQHIESGEMLKDVVVVADSAGVVLGLHNVAIVLPQLLVSLFSTLIFARLSPAHGALDAPTRRAEVAVTYDSIGLIFRLGGVCAAVASYLSWRLVQEEWSRKKRRRSRTSG